MLWVLNLGAGRTRFKSPLHSTGWLLGQFFFHRVTTVLKIVNIELGPASSLIITAVVHVERGSTCCNPNSDIVSKIVAILLLEKQTCHFPISGRQSPIHVSRKWKNRGGSEMMLWNASISHLGENPEVMSVGQQMFKSSSWCQDRFGDIPSLSCPILKAPRNASRWPRIPVRKIYLHCLQQSPPEVGHNIDQIQFEMLEFTWKTCSVASPELCQTASLLYAGLEWDLTK